jgi:hypothetical protein
MIINILKSIRYKKVEFNAEYFEKCEGKKSEQEKLPTALF